MSHGSVTIVSVMVKVTLSNFKPYKTGSCRYNYTFKTFMRIKMPLPNYARPNRESAVYIYLLWRKCHD